MESTDFFSNEHLFIYSQSLSKDSDPFVSDLFNEIANRREYKLVESNLTNTNFRQNEISTTTNSNPQISAITKEDSHSISNVDTINCKIQKITKKKEQKKIFLIEKVKKENTRIGRMNKTLKDKYTGKHNKFSEDNIIKKVKTRFVESSLGYINRQYELHMNKHKIKKVKKLLQRIEPKAYIDIKKEANKNWFNLSLEVFFSSDLSKKCSNFTSNYNREQIKTLCDEGEAKNVIEILKKEIKEQYEDYISDVKKEGLKTLETDLKELRDEMEKEKEENIEEYLKTYEKTAKDLMSIFDLKKGRNRLQQMNSN